MNDAKMLEYAQNCTENFKRKANERKEAQTGSTKAALGVTLNG